MCSAFMSWRLYSWIRLNILISRRQIFVNIFVNSIPYLYTRELDTIDTIFNPTQKIYLFF